MRKYLFIFIFIFLSLSKVNAASCDAYDIKRLKEIADGVEITYELQEPMMVVDTMVNDIYKLNITGLTNELFVYNETNDEIYDINTDMNNKFIFSGRKKLKIRANGCTQTLRAITLKLPIYNVYYGSDFCLEENNKDLDICQEWIDKEISEREFLTKVYNEEEKNKQENSFIQDNLYIIIGGIVLFIIIIVTVIIFKRKKEVLV